MKNLILKSLLLFISIPLFNSIAFGIGSIFYNPQQSTINADQFIDYQNITITLLTILALSIPLIELVYQKLIKDNFKISLIYLTLVVVITVISFGQLTLRPLEHGLTLLCIASVILTRLLLNKKFDRLN